MSSNWVSNLDMLAAGGVIDFDAASYLLDQPARFVGNPQIERLPLENPALLPEGVRLKDLPQADEFAQAPKDRNLVETPKWKKWALGGIIAAGIGAGFFAITKGKLKMPDMTSVKNFGNTVLTYIKKPFEWIANKFKKPTP